MHGQCSLMCSSNLETQLSSQTSFFFIFLHRNFMILVHENWKMIPWAVGSFVLHAEHKFERAAAGVVCFWRSSCAKVIFWISALHKFVHFQHFERMLRQDNVTCSNSDHTDRCVHVQSLDLWRWHLKMLIFDRMLPVFRFFSGGVTGLIQLWKCSPKR